MESVPKRRGRPPIDPDKRACRMCGETDLGKFYECNRTYCIPCFRSRNLAKAKEYRQVDIQEKLSRECCLVCKRKVTEDTLHYFEWNHRDPKEKSHNVSQLVFVPKKYKQEVEKCDLVCLFCHADITKQQIADGGLFGRPRSYHV